MYAVVVRVKIENAERAQEMLQSDIVPRVSQAPGFKAGYWTRAGDGGVSMVIFDSEENARAAAERVGPGMPEGVNLQDVEVCEVVASA